MQTIGEEQNIQTLFRDLRLDDERVAPGFDVVWNSAQAKTRPAPGFKLSFVAATVILVLTLFSFALWLRDRRSNQQQNNSVGMSPASLAEVAKTEEMKPEQQKIPPARTIYRANARQRVLRLAARRRAEPLALRLAEIRDAVAISSWQSPTAMLMQSPADDVVTSLPQLYRSVSELDSFLPDIQN